MNTKSRTTYEFPLFPLPYEYDALEPRIDTLTMKLHHDRHLKGYTDKLNAALKPYPAFHNRTLEWLLRNSDLLPPRIRTAVRNNGGGVYNHIYYFAGMSPPGDSTPVPDGKLGTKIERAFGGWDEFKEKFKSCALDVFGAGYLWLVANKRGQLRILPTPNQDTPIAMGFCPIMTIDLWEHAYYLKHYNDRAGYIDDWFAVLNTEFIERNYECCVC
jgi:Fe-Mn family superoxide dismutase